MRKVKSCGVLLFRELPERAFLLMKSRRHFDLPKGHLERGETEVQCALREAWEETGVPREDIALEHGFRFETVYYPRYRRCGGQTVEKTLVVFLGWVPDDSEVQPVEHVGFEWFPWSPPHQIQTWTVDPLLAEVEAFFAKGGVRETSGFGLQTPGQELKDQ